MNSAKEKLAGMRWLLIKPTKFFEDVVRNGKYTDGLIFLAALAVLIGVGAVVGDPTLTADLMAADAAKVSLVLFICLVVITSIWGLFAALIGLRMRPRIAAVLTFKEAAPRCLRIVMFSLAPLALLFFHGNLLLGLSLVGVLIFSVIGVAKALSIKILPALILQLIVCGGIFGGAAMGIESFIKDPARQSTRTHPSHKLVGQPAPDILIQPTGGTPLHLSELKGKNVVIIDFWATWCPPCRFGLPIVSEVAAKYKDRGVVFYAIGDGSIEQEKVYLEQRKIDAIPASSNAEGFAAFMVNAIPETVVIDKAGVVRAVHVGLSPNEKEELSSEIESALQAK
ncbi:MAG: TlpA family protein disulfide reductase [Candidatus Melainabacteria bacterium]|nr:TlpA family protein disulfide reductase [Candidatus Melainabacteria bacterium]